MIKKVEKNIFKIQVPLSNRKLRPKAHSKNNQFQTFSVNSAPIKLFPVRTPKIEFPLFLADPLKDASRNSYSKIDIPSQRRLEGDARVYGCTRRVIYDSPRDTLIRIIPLALLSDAEILFTESIDF